MVHCLFLRRALLIVLSIHSIHMSTSSRPLLSYYYYLLLLLLFFFLPLLFLYIIIPNIILRKKKEDDFFLSSFFLSFFLLSFFLLSSDDFIHSFIQIFLDFSSVRGDYIDHSRQHHQICIFLGVLISNSTLPIIFFQQKKHILNKFSIKLNRNVLFNFLMGFQSLL